MVFIKRVFIILFLLSSVFVVTGCHRCSSGNSFKDYWDIPVKQVHDLPDGFGPPVCIVWYKPIPGTDKWQVYKTFSSAVQMFEIKELLRTDVHEMFKFKSIEDYPDSQAHAEAFKGDQQLSFMYHEPRRNTLTIRNMEFNISDEMFIWPAGQSKKLYKIFMGQEEWGDYQKLMDEMYYKTHGHYPGESKSDNTDSLMQDFPFMPLK